MPFLVPTLPSNDNAPLTHETAPGANSSLIGDISSNADCLPDAMPLPAAVLPSIAPPLSAAALLVLGRPLWASSPEHHHSCLQVGSVP